MNRVVRYIEDIDVDAVHIDVPTIAGGEPKLGFGSAKSIRKQAAIP